MAKKEKKINIKKEHKIEVDITLRVPKGEFDKVLKAMLAPKNTSEKEDSKDN